MSNFEDWKKFPARCGSLLTLYYPDAEKNDREVTLLLAVASACICIRRDHLAKKENINYDEPIGNKFEKFSSKKVPGELKQSRHAEYHHRDIEGRRPDEWPGFHGIENASPNTTNGKVLRILRNALSHGTLFLHGKPDIDQIVFLSQIIEYCSDSTEGSWKGKYDCLVLTPGQLFAFVSKWIKWCEAHESSAEMVATLLDTCDRPVAA